LGSNLQILAWEEGEREKEREKTSLMNSYD